MLASSSTAASLSPSSLEEWSFAIDNVSGNVYFYNRRTRETRWTLPSSAESGDKIANSTGAAKSSSLISSLSNAHSVMKSIELESQQNHAKANSGASGAAGETGSLASRIREAVDPQTGRKYFYDPLTRESFWEDPTTLKTEAVAAAPNTTSSVTDQRINIAKERENKDGKVSDLLLLKRQNKTKLTATETVSAVSARNASENVKAPLASKKHIDDDDDETDPHRKGGLSIPASIETSPTQNLENLHERSQRKHLVEAAGLSLSKSSSEERAIPSLALFRTEATFNKNDLRLLKQRLNKSQSASPGRSEKGVIKSLQNNKPKTLSVSPQKSPPKTTRSNNQAPKALSITVKNTVPSSGLAQRGVDSTKCLRMSGCPCQACTTGSTAGPVDEDDLNDDRTPCGTCGRKFAPKALAVHERVCTKVFMRKSGGGESSDKKPSKTESAKSTSRSTSSGLPKWRKQSLELRNAMQRGRGVTDSSVLTQDGQTKGEQSALEVSALTDNGLVLCPHCERRFSDKAAERHIPKCQDIRSKPKTLRKGEGRAAHNFGSPIVGGGAVDASPSRTPKIGSAPAIQQRMSTGTSLVPCVHCKKSFTIQTIERHVEVCPAQQRRPFSSVVGVRSTRMVPSLLANSPNVSRRLPVSPADSASSWDGEEY